MKKMMMLAMCLILAGLLAVNGTFAGDFTKSIADIFTDLTDRLFGAPKTDAAFEVSLVYVDEDGNPLTASTPPQLLPGQTIVRYTAVHHQSAGMDAAPNNAYFRIAFAVQQEAYDLLTFDFSSDARYNWSEWKAININGKPYQMLVGTYTQPLAAGSISPAALKSVTLKSDVTSAQLAQVRDDFLQIQVLAIAADDFVDSNGKQMDAITALNHALPLNSLNPF